METYQASTKVDQITNESFEQFQASFGGPLIGADNEIYDAERLLWNKLIDKRPGIIAQCTGVSDVIQAVNFARENNLLVSVRGAGHNVAGNASIDDGLVIDLSHMRTVMVDPQKKTAVVQGGANWGDVDRETQAFNLVCAGGVVSDTGVGGLTLGGGLSWFRRKAGMSIDNLIGADMVLADGSYVHASESENQDLFWGIKGGGGNFGIVTSFHFKLYELGPNVMMAACMYPRAEAEKIMKFWIEFTRTLPNEVTSDCIHWSIPEHPGFPEELHNTKVTVLAAMYFGSPEDGERILQPLREVAEPLLDLSGVIPFTAVNKMFDPFLVKGTLNSYWKSLYVNDIDQGLIDLIIGRANAAPSNQCLLSIRNLQGAISEVPEDATAFGDRNARFLVSIDTMWEDDSLSDKCISWTKEYFDELHKYSNGQVYFNFNSDMSGSNDLALDSFGENYKKLIAIKSKYDPDNFFRMNANIKPNGQH
jgi:FAD/FMN-containing dehydrogenase